MYFIYFHSLDIKGNWTHLAQKNRQQGAKINTIFLENILNILKHQSFNNGANKNQAINIFVFEQI